MDTANDLTLDGNATAGLRSEVFGPEATGAVARCGSCGAEGPVGTLLAHAPVEKRSALETEALVAGDVFPRDASVIEVHVRELSQLFNSMDPSPFLEKDLDVDAEEFIAGWAREVPSEKSLALLVHLDQPVVRSREGSILRDAVHCYFKHRWELSGQRLRELLRLGRTSLLIGVAFLATCLLIGDWLTKLLTDSRIAGIAREGLTIGGWVAMWRPMEIFLYGWWPILRERRIQGRLSRMPVRIVCNKAEKSGSPSAV
jgi:hypothetical protein